jgi:tagatose 6-phosphate kinase
MYFIDDFVASKKFKEIAPQIFIGGKGVNIAKVVTRLSEKCTLYSFIGGYGGQLIRREMERFGVDFKYCEINGEIRTTINVIDNKNHQETEITESGAAVSPEWEAALLGMIKDDISSGDIVICSGIPMAGMKAGVYKTISLWCREKGAKCILDTNSRYLIESFPAQYSFMKPNLAEIKELHQIDAIQDDAQLFYLAQKTLKMGIENLLISTGSSGGMFFSKDVALKISVPDEPVASTIGSGDSTVAGFCIALQKGYPLKDCLKYAMACGVCNAMHPQVGYAEKKEVEKLMPQITIDPILPLKQ